MDELQTLQAELIKTAVAADPEKIIQFLRLLREFRIRDSESVVRYGKRLLERHASLLSEEELWLVHEQVAVAALDINCLNLASQLIRAVLRKFSQSSSRARRLLAMAHEARGEYDKAADIYNDMKLADPGNVGIRKRQIALEKSRGNTMGAIEQLNEYLTVFQTDMEAWQELAELAIEAQLYKQAAYCLEELIMTQPTSLALHIKYADVQYTLGGPAALRLARAHYAKAVELSAGTSARALYGILACAAALGTKHAAAPSAAQPALPPSSQPGDAADAAAKQAAAVGLLPKAAGAALLKMYHQQAPDKAPLVASMVDKLTSSAAS